MSSKTEKLINEMTEIIVGEVDPKQVILFSSQARGAPRPDSDLDFIIVQDHPFGPVQVLIRA
jgi:predicted nucleotidyltransferase